MGGFPLECSDWFVLFIFRKPRHSHSRVAVTVLLGGVELVICIARRYMLRKLACDPASHFVRQPSMPGVGAPTVPESRQPR